MRSSLDAPLRVAAYCRVSTDKEDQLNSLSAQQQFFQTYIAGHPGWIPVGVFADEGLSGTSVKHRTQFQKLVQMALDGEIDLILTKEVSRFARNTVDTLQVTRRLKEKGIGVLFLNDNIDTRDNDGEFRLTIMASVAQEESRKISERTRWGQTQAMKRGVVFGNNSIFGYILSEGKLIVQPEQAEVVRAIFHRFLTERKGSHTIARELTQAGVRPPLRASGSWSSTMVLRVLRNEKYCGDLLQKKYRTTDYLSHRKIRNDGAEEQCLLKDHHEAIVSREIFQAAQEELDRRGTIARSRGKFSAKYWYSGKVRCGLCGKSFTLKRTRRKDGTEYQRFVCRGHQDGSGCGAPGVNAQVIYLCARHVLGQLALDRDAIIGQLLEELRVIREQHSASQPDQCEKLRQALQRQQERKDRAQEAFLDGDLSREDMRRLTERCDGEIRRLEDQLKDMEDQQQADAELMARYAEIRALLEKELDGGDAVLDEVIRTITIYPDNFLVTLTDFPVRFRLRVEKHGSGRTYAIRVTECTPIPLKS